MPSSPRSSPVLLCLIAVGLAAGAGAALVASAQAPFHPGHDGGTPYVVPEVVLGVLAILPLSVGFGFLIYRRVTRGGIRIPGPLIAGVLVVLLLLTVFVYVGPHLNPGPTAGVGSTSPTNSTGTTNTSSGGGGSSGATPSWHVPSAPKWIPFVVVAVVALALAGILVPTMWSTVVARQRRGGGPRDLAAAKANAQAALEGAVSALAAGEDPRAVIERLYVRLLDRVSAMAGDLSGRTPEEIRAETLLPLGVRPAAAAALTRLFEEARYSTHALGPEDAARVRAAVSAAANDLARSVTAR